MKQGILILCLKVRASPWGNAPCRSFLRFIHGPTDESLRTSSSRVAGASCSHSTCVVLPDFRYLQVSERSQRGSLVFFFSFPLLLWSSSFTDKKWRMSSIYSAMHHLKVLSRSNSLLQPGVLSPYDFHVCFLSCICRTRAAAAAKSLQSCPTLCDPMDRSPPGSPIPGILQARTLEWVAISFSNP